MEKQQLLEDLKKKIEGLAFDDEATLDGIRRNAEMLIRNYCGKDSNYLNDLKRIRFYPGFAPVRDDYKRKCWETGKKIMINLTNTMLEEFSLFGGKQQKLISSKPVKSKRIFIVHGHDEAVKNNVTRFLEKLELEPVILHEQPNKGRTIIEKISDYSDVAFAVVLLTPDDKGGLITCSPEKLQSRARQNVIFELGYFIGRLERHRVCALYKEGLEIPSDYKGVLFIKLDDAGAWRLELAKEMKEAGIAVDMNKTI